MIVLAIILILIGVFIWMVSSIEALENTTMTYNQSGKVAGTIGALSGFVIMFIGVLMLLSSK